MPEIKIQCDCGQKYKFDVTPVNGRMPFTVSCPLCGSNGTDKANKILEETLGVSGAAALSSHAPVNIALTSRIDAPALATVSAPPPPAQPAGSKLRISAAAPPVPPAVPVAPRPMTSGGVPTRSLPVRKGKDGWAVEESSFNKMGSYVVLIPSILGALLTAGFFGIEVPGTIVAGVVAVAGVIGGIINILGRGPIFAGMIVGLAMALGGYGAVYFWIHDRDSVPKYEIAIAFILGAAPGYFLQFLLQKILQKRTEKSV